MADAYASNVVLACPFNEYVPGTKAIHEGSGFAAAGIPQGAATLSSAQSKFGGYSLGLMAAGYVVFPASALLVLAGDFTIEAWVYRTAGTMVYLIGQSGSANSPGIYLNNGYVFSAIGSLVHQTTVAQNAWNHIALVRSNNVLRLYLNGVGSTATTTNGNTLSFSNGLYIGASGHSDMTPFYGYIDDFRITNGIARYTADFTPPAAFEYIAPSAVIASLLDPEMSLSDFPMPPSRLVPTVALTAAIDMYFGGDGKIVGTTMNTPSTPVSRRVRLYESRSGNLVRERWSDTSGNYAFAYLNRGYTYYVVGFDHTDQYQGVVADKLVPEVM